MICTKSAMSPSLNALSISCAARQHKAAVRCQEPLAKAIAAAKGPDSAAAKGLEELRLRRTVGEEVIIFPFRGHWVVGLAEDIERRVRQAATQASTERQPKTKSEAIFAP